MLQSIRMIRLIDRGEEESLEKSRGDAGQLTESEWQRLYDSEFESLVRLAMRIVGNRSSAEDVAQEAFLRLLSDGGRVARRASWLRTVAVRICYDRLRAQTAGERRDRRMGREAEASVAPSAEQEWEARARRTRLRRALESLPERDRRALELRYSGFSYREIAQEIHVDGATVGTLLLRAMKKLKREYEREEDKIDEHGVLHGGSVVALLGSGD
ncbi:MAG: sigma-70 family RNA polymerase sigma factor [Bacilli bacterium]